MMSSVTSAQWIFLAVVFVAVFGFGLMAAYLLAPDPTRTKVRELALEGAPMAPGGESRAHWIERIVHLTGPLARLSIPDEGWERSPLRVRFMNAGLRGPSTPAAYFTAKSVLAIGLPLLVFFILGLSGAKLAPAVTMASLLIAAAIGYYLPNAVLAHMVERRQRTILESFPDALDLLTVCVEAGLGLDAALLRVATEMEATSPVLSEELHLVNLELRAGSSKEKALRNLSLRTGVEDVDTLVAMLIQAERFGTSVADSLRVHSDALRTKRRLRAEEAAAKIPIKLLFPLIFCIFPSMMLVLLGPAFIRILRVFFPLVQGVQ
jgi:tight adherence protein C